MEAKFFFSNILEIFFSDEKINLEVNTLYNCSDPRCDIHLHVPLVSI